MILIVPVVLLVVLVIFPTIRCAVFHPFLMAWNSGRDVWYYFRHKEYNRCSSGELMAYCGLFGKGKTLSAVHKVVRAYHRYDGKPVWCPRRKKLVTQRIKVISNVSLAIPYEDFVSLEQVVLDAERKAEYDDTNETLTVTLVLGDEFSVQMNSRNFGEGNIVPILFIII